MVYFSPKNYVVSCWTCVFLGGLYMSITFFVQGDLLDDCRTIQFRQHENDVILTKHVIRSEQVAEKDACVLKCYFEPNCVSYNYGPLRDGSFLCELNDKTHLQVPLNELEAKDNFIYRPIVMNACQSSPCKSNSTCQAGFGDQGYRCMCSSGYHGDTCEFDVDECSMTTHDCSSLADCSNVMGSFQCTCKYGFTGDGKTCQDVDECASEETNKCDAAANCINTEGSFQCTCHDGYSGDGYVCTALGSTKEVAVASCKSLTSLSLSSGVYWLDPDGGSMENSFKAYCEMETDGGGWTLVWSYSFTDYVHFKSNNNAIIPRPNWPDFDEANVPVSTTSPLSETDFNAVEFPKWKDFGTEFFIKSNTNNWIICSPSTGSLVEWRSGSVNCSIAKSITEQCANDAPPDSFGFTNPCGPRLKGGKNGNLYFYFDGCKEKHWPTHDPCGSNGDNGLKNVQNPHGNIFIR